MSSLLPAYPVSTVSVLRKNTVEWFCRSGEKWKLSAISYFIRLVDIQYERNDIDFKRGTFRVRGDVVKFSPFPVMNIACGLNFLVMKLNEFVK